MPSPIYRTQRYINSDVTVQPGVRTTGSPVAWTVTGPAHTSLTASTEAPDVLLNCARTVQFATGALAEQSAVKISAPTYGFVGASTLTDAATLTITAAPTAGTNATLTRTWAVRVKAGNVCLVGDIHVGNSVPTAGPARRIHIKDTTTAQIPIRCETTSTSGYAGIEFFDDTAAQAGGVFWAGSAASAVYASAVSLYANTNREIRFVYAGALAGKVDTSKQLVWGASNVLTVGNAGDIGLYGHAAAAQDTGGQDVTNNVTDSGSTAGTIPDITDGTTYANDYTNLRRALYQLARLVKQDHDWLRSVGALT